MALAGIVVAGCGRMGAGMLRGMRRAGLDATGYDIRSSAEFGDLAPAMLPDAAALRAKARIVFSVVRDAAETDRLLFDDQALLAAPGPLEVLVISSTLSPRYLSQVASRAPAGLTLVDAPMSGAQIAAEERRLSFMLGGDAAALDRLQPCFAAMGAHFHRMGGFGAGMSAKVLNNFVAGASVAATRQALEWAKDLGLSTAALRDLMHDSSGQTWFGSNFDQIEFAREGIEALNTVAVLKKDVEAGLDATDPEDALGQAIIAKLAALRPFRDQ